ncbi:MAG TPA: phosphate ABC transporter permease subunit PstC, partial [Desulfobulbus sp.]|nr:phosphate ABC transporter permease subunit PstC [Desulfobulbus sp.]
MNFALFPALLVGASSVAYFLGKRRASTLAGPEKGSRRLHSRPGYYGMLTALWCLIPALLLFGAWLAFSDTFLTALTVKTLPPDMQNLPPDQMNLLVNDLHNLVAGHVAARDINPILQKAADQYIGFRRMGTTALELLMGVVALLFTGMAYIRIRPEMRARNQVEKTVKIVLIGCSSIAVLTTVGIVLSVLFESIRFFGKVPITDFLFGLKWSPQIALRADQVGSSGAFGAVPVLAGTVMISSIALAVAVPIGLLSAIYLSEYAGRRV